MLTRELTASKDARLWDAASGKQLAVLRHGDQVSSAVFNRDGKKVLTASDDQTARLWDAGTGKELRALTGHEGRLSSAVFSPSGAKVLTTSLDHTTRLWDAASGKSLVVLHHGQESVDAIFSPDGRKVLTVSEKAPARIWDAESGKELGSLRGHSYEPKASAFALDGQTVATIAFSPDGRTVVTGSADHTARLWDAESGRELSVLRHEGWVNAVAFSPDGGTLATVSAGVHLWPLGQHLIDRACARVHDLPLSDENKKRLGIEEWCTPEISGALRDRLRQYQASGRPPQ